jgi:hypothetical protein
MNDARWCLVETRTDGLATDGLAADGWQVAIVGDSCDAERTSLVLGAMQAGALYLAGAMTPATLAALTGDARLILSENAEGSRWRESREIVAPR